MCDGLGRVVTIGGLGFVIEHGTLEDRFACQLLVVGGTISAIVPLDRLVVQAWCDA
jgi:hypothetical protein